jgi:hypothetical protein
MLRNHLFCYVRYGEADRITEQIGWINRMRSTLIPYDYLIQSDARQGWTAILIPEMAEDHYLMRNLSGRLNGVAFELVYRGLAFGYRIHEGGQTIDSFESNLSMAVNYRILQLRDSAHVRFLDLAEPLDRFVLQRYQGSQYTRQRDIELEEIPQRLIKAYAGNVMALSPFLSLGTDINYVARLLEPGYSPEVAFEWLLNVLNLPYLPSDSVELPGTDDEPTEYVTGYALTSAQTWEQRLPPGWRRLTSDLWEK